ncbi:DNA alkylation repair protein [Spirosoma montaniterrae]|uniref:DNA alkylation repair protein n=1 Tax=Spirosoma montaniterrae TaxID=1178516 RepID=A0A1P9X019_9BACT|nr:DNA alkylation repair protein [Spirosoma montaniterrae]AQG80962.1 DNA alkylation repair protein [Spirosoma montaniterrae]
MTHSDVKQTLLALEQPERASFAARFFKTKPGQYGEGDVFLGLSMPQQHAIAKQYQALAADEVEKLLREPYHECRMTGLLIWVYQSKKASSSQRAKLAERYLANRYYVNNWDLVDVTCPHVLGRHLLNNDRSVLYDLAGEDHLWSQRIAIVTTLAFIRLGQFGDTFALAERLLPHKHDLIHKAIGWMLREVGKRSPDALEEFLHDHLPQMPRTALRYAIEKFDPARRQYYLTKK